MTIFGTAGNDNKVGTNGDNIFDMSQGGRDFASGLGGNDIFNFGAELRGSDEIHGGTGFDTLNLDGDYAFGAHFTATTIEGIEQLTFATGHTYKLFLNDGNVAAAQVLTIDGSAIDVAHHLIFDGSNELDGLLHITGSLGNDTLTGGGASDTFDLTLGSIDRVKGGAGNDFFNLGDTLRASDRVNGGLDSNTVNLAGDYSFGLHFDPATMVNIGTLNMAALHDYKLILDDGNIAAGATLSVHANTGVGDVVSVDGSQETDGKIGFTGGASDDVFFGGAGNDSFSMSLGGDDIVKGGGGSDSFFFLATFSLGDHVDGGSGADNMSILGNYSAGMVLTTAQLVNVETITIFAGFSYKLATTDGVVAAGQTLGIGGALAAGETLTFNGSAETDGRFAFGGGAGDDILIGGSQNDLLSGGLGADKLTGGAGPDMFLYSAAASASTSTTHDTITGFDALVDDFTLFVTGIAVDAEITAGTLRFNNFDSDLSTATAALASHHAVLFTPNAGGLAGRTFLVVNTDGAAGYQSGVDLVIEMKNMLNKASLDTGDFH